MKSTVLVKAFLLLEILSRQVDASSLASLAQDAGLAKPTVHRLMDGLISLGYVERVSSGRYGLTSKLRNLGTGYKHQQMLVLAEPVLSELHSVTDETVNFGEIRRDRIFYLRVLESPHPLRKVVKEGESDPVYSTAMGRAILSCLPHLQQDEFFKQLSTTEKTDKTDKTIRDLAEFRAMLDSARKAGYATERDENVLGVTCFGAPVQDHSGVVAAISVSMPTARIPQSKEKSLIKALTKAAARITQALASPLADD